MDGIATRACVAQLYAPQVGETRLAVSSPAMTSASEIGAELLSAVAPPFPPPRFWSKDRPARGDAASAPPKDAHNGAPFFCARAVPTYRRATCPSGPTSPRS